MAAYSMRMLSIPNGSFGLVKYFEGTVHSRVEVRQRENLLSKQGLLIVVPIGGHYDYEASEDVNDPRPLSPGWVLLWEAPSSMVPCWEISVAGAHVGRLLRSAVMAVKQKMQV